MRGRMLSVEGDRERGGGYKELVRVWTSKAFHLPLKMSLAVTQLRNEHSSTAGHAD